MVLIKRDGSEVKTQVRQLFVFDNLGLVAILAGVWSARLGLYLLRDRVIEGLPPLGPGPLRRNVALALLCLGSVRELLGAGSLFFVRHAIWQMIHSPHLNTGTLALVDADIVALLEARAGKP